LYCISLYFYCISHKNQNRDTVTELFVLSFVHFSTENRDFVVHGPIVIWWTFSFVSGLAPSYSIQGWIHSKRRNRSGQDLVECLVCTHTNLQLEHHLEIYETDMFPWDLEMTVEESLSDDEDEDGVPQCVSDSESESENDSD
jgi:hypothetical protein